MDANPTPTLWRAALVPLERDGSQVLDPSTVSPDAARISACARRPKLPYYSRTLHLMSLLRAPRTSSARTKRTRASIAAAVARGLRA